MKKLLAILLAMMLVMVSVVAFAAGEDGANTVVSVDTGYNAQTAPTIGLNAAVEQTVDVGKIFKVKGYNQTAQTPVQPLTFEPKKCNKVEEATTATVATAPEIVSIVSVPANIPEGKVNTDTTSSVRITLPVYTAVGIYYYPVKENDMNVAGITYPKESDLYLKVTVIQGQWKDDKGALNDGLVIAGIALYQDSKKTDTIENQYDSGALEISKTVTGTGGDYNAVWEFKVDFAAPQGDTVNSTIAITGTGTVKDSNTENANVITSIPGATISVNNNVETITGTWTTKTVYVYLTHGQKVEFDNLPAGVTYTVTETADANYKTTYKLNGSDTAVTGNATANTTAITSEKLDTVEFINDRDMPVDTGVTLESSAYVLIMALALAGFVMLAIRRREEY